MTLHGTAETFKKGGIFTSIALGVIILLVVFFRIGNTIKETLNPPRIDLPNQTFGKIPALVFPQSTVNGDFTYSIETLTGTLPENFPDRLIIYPTIQNTPGLNDLKSAKEKLQRLGFIDIRGLPIPEAHIDGPNYEWTETSGLERQLLYNVVSRDFTMTSNYLQSNTVLRADSQPSATKALGAIQSYLSIMDSMAPDIDFEKTRNPDPKNTFNTKPQLYSIYGQNLVPAKSIEQTQVVRVDLYQKDIEYSLIAGQNNELTKFQTFPMKLPILYPRPPYSTMNFYAASGTNGVEVDSAIFNHQTINTTPKSPLDPPATYPIKTAEEAFKELQAGNGYIAAYHGTDQQILIDNVYLAYYFGETKQDYLMPIIVFEGQNGFFAYISAVKDEALQ